MNIVMSHRQHSLLMYEELTNVVLAGLEGQTEDSISVGGVELLRVGVAIIDDTKSGNVVDNVIVLRVVEVTTTVVTTVTGGQKNMKILYQNRHQISPEEGE